MNKTKSDTEKGCTFCKQTSLLAQVAWAKSTLNKDVHTQTMLMARQQKIEKLFEEDFRVTQ